jgi:N-acetyl-gamma-glutamyl-phosphate reductase
MKLLQLLRAHPRVDSVRVGARGEAGEPLSSRLPFLCEAEGLRVEPLEALAEEPGAALFCCLPSGVSPAMAARARSRGARVVDLGGDLRLRDAAARARWYPQAAAAPPAEPAVYGLSELARQEVAGAGLVANPGCYATAALLALAPLARSGLLADGAVIIDAKSGVSGAGRAAELRLQFCEMHDQIAPYAAGREHRHVAEIEQALAGWSGHAQGIVFTPHLVPADRGVLVCAYVRLGSRATAADLRSLYARAYEREIFVRLLPEGALPDTRSVRGSNRCDVGLRWVPEASTLLIVTALDNLMKGAAGQAVQNFNLMFGLPEDAGLPVSGDPL